MSNLDFIEKDLIDSLLNSGGYVLDFSNRTFQKFVYEKIQIDVYAKYKDLSKGRMLNALIDDLDDITAGKLILEFLRYMQYKDMVKDENTDKFKKCAEIGNRLIGKTVHIKTSSNKEASQPTPITSVVDFDKYLKELQILTDKSDTPQERGFAFEKYLKSLFEVFALQPRGSFKTTGEQIDGSFVLRDECYLLEAKWTTKPIDKSQLVILNEKVSSRSGFTRGLFISFSNFTDEAIASFANGRTVNIILMTVQELAIVLSKQQSLETVLWQKVRLLAEEGNFNKNVMELL
jgi:hypothetical protein